MKRRDVTGNCFECQLGKKKLYNTPYFIVLASSVKILEVKATFTEYSDIVIYQDICN